VRYARDEVLLQNRGSGKAEVVPAWIGRLLSTCDRPATMEHHARQFSDVGETAGIGRAAVDDALRRLVTNGFLVTTEELLSPARRKGERQDPRGAPHLSRIVWVTKNRPKTLERSVLSFLASVSTPTAYGISIVDDTDNKGDARATWATVREVRKRGASVAHLEASAAGDYVENLTDVGRDSGVPPDVVEFSLYGIPELNRAYGLVTLGANRNRALLHHAGEPVLMCDDDIVFRLGLTGPSERVLVGGYNESISRHALSGAEEAARLVPAWEGDLASVHAELLGRPVSSVADAAESLGQLDLTNLNPRSARRLQNEAPTIVATCTTYYGDAGMNEAWFALEVEALRRGGYEETRLSREYCRKVSGILLADSGPLIPMVAAIDNTVLVPPFFPVARGSDVIWGEVATTVLGDFIAHLPHAVQHAPLPRRWYSEASYEYSIRIADVIQALVRDANRFIAPETPRQHRMETAGAFLESVSSDPRDFLERLRMTAGGILEGHLLALGQNSSGSEGTRDDTERADRQRFEQSLERGLLSLEESFLPFEVRSLGVREGTEALRVLVRQYGRLLRWWPTLRAAALELGVKEKAEHGR